MEGKKNPLTCCGQNTQTALPKLGSYDNKNDSRKGFFGAFIKLQGFGQNPSSRNGTHHIGVGKCHICMAKTAKTVPAETPFSITKNDTSFVLPP